MLIGEAKQTFERLLVEHDYLSEDQLKDLRQESAETNQSIINIISERKLVDEEELVKTVAEADNMPYANLNGFKVAAELLDLIPKDLARSYQVVPIGMISGRLAVGMIDPTNVQAIDFVARKIGRSIMPHMVSGNSIAWVLNQYKADVSKELSAVVGASSQFALGEQAKQQQKAAAVNTLVQDAPITRALNTILEYAASAGASDIHIEPREHELKVRLRVDGILQEAMSLPKEVEPALISRIKILATLKIDEHRVPQDGEFQIQHEGRDVDLRIAIAPLIWGEQVVIRLLDKDPGLLSIDSLGYAGRANRLIHEGLTQPHGMTLSTGPTGSGKSTTLYASLNTIKDVSINIVTLEDPVEYKMDGINQIQVNTQVGLTFASGLRSILRQDPNVVMVGEIRDPETADLAVQAALTGHVVLSTLHTNSASGVLPRLIDMGIEPFLIASTVNTVIGQRLVRRICDKCVEGRSATEAEMLAIKKTLKGVLPESGQADSDLREDLGYESLPSLADNAYTLYKGRGCDQCVDGYKGRTGIFEVFNITPEMEKLLASQTTSTQVQDQAKRDGMITMKQDGFLKALNKVTTLEEVMRVASDA